ncbi:MAG: site-2 protease family protein [Phycisphaerales bacterium]|nr:site-2 protease family protein [Phycisphaerales bacterium]
MELLTTGTNLLVVVLGFGVLILVHEAGHFLAAKWAGIRTEAFAIGMGPVVCSWRRGVGFCFGSTDAKVASRFGKEPSAMSDAELARHGLGETEYSLRWLPLGGFVKMLGQEDLNPAAVSSDARSYGNCPIGKRMIVVSAGVVMNLVLAVILFIVAFLAGVRVEAPLVGAVDPDGPAARAVVANAAEAGITEPGLQPGDRVLSIDGDEARSFADLRIAAAMGRAGVPLELRLERAGVPVPLEVSVEPAADARSGLLSIGVDAASGTTLTTEPELRRFVDLALARTGLDQAGVRPGMTLLSVDGRPVRAWQQVESAVQPDGAPLATVWGRLPEPDAPASSATDVVHATLSVRPDFLPQIQPEPMPEGIPEFEAGLIGLVPLTRIEEVGPESINDGILMPGDVVVRIGTLDAPSQVDFRRTLSEFKNGTVPLRVLRDGKEIEVEGKVNRNGQLNVLPGPDLEHAVIARPLEQVGTIPTIEHPRRVAVNSPVNGLGLLGRSTIESVDGQPVSDWPSFRQALLAATRSVGDDGTTVELMVRPPTSGAQAERVVVELGPEEVARLQRLGWSVPLDAFLFDPVEAVLTAEGNPLRAVAMGFQETHKLVLMTYLTIDRLVRGSVGVEQLRGPVGIVHLGTRIADRGFTYLLFFMAMISVNLAVLNFLPLPIVDGGLFLFLVYEKIKGRPPSIAFQNAATIAGLFLIGALFLVTFYNDVMRLVG